MSETQLFVMRGGYNNMWKIVKHTELFFRYVHNIQSASAKTILTYTYNMRVVHFYCVQSMSMLVNLSRIIT